MSKYDRWKEVRGMSKNTKRGIIILVIMLVVGFASVSTTLIISGIVGIASNEDDFNIIFTDAKLNNVDRKDFV